MKLPLTLRAGLAATAVLALTACTHVRSLQTAVNPEESWAVSQRQANVQAVVFKDEQYRSLLLFNLEGDSGGGRAEQAYRTIAFQMIHSEGGRPIGHYAGFKIATAVVPDGMPLLKEGDLIEVRNVKHYDYLKDFAATGEGNAVLRLLCPSSPRSADKDAFKRCASNANWYKPWGEEKRFYYGINAAPSGRPYLATLKQHTELSFTPYYDETGARLPSAVAPAVRPDINTWVFPKLP